MKRWLLYLVFLAVCVQSCKTKTAENQTAKMDSSTTPVTQKNIDQQAGNIIDSGQVWFRVAITKNDSPYLRYEGEWPLLLMTNDFATLQLGQSKNLMSVTPILTIYMNGLPTAKVPVQLSSSEKNTASMIMMPVVNGGYGLPISASEGFLNITKNSGGKMSGSFEAKASDDKDKFMIRGDFLNVKINNEDKM